VSVESSINAAVRQWYFSEVRIHVYQIRMRVLFAQNETKI